MASFPGQNRTGSPLPNAPLTLAVTGTTSTSVSLSWTAPLGGSISYNLYRNGVRVQTGIAGTSTTDTGLSASTTYTYYVTSQQSIGEGSASNRVNGTTGSSGASINWNPGFRARANNGAQDGSNSNNIASVAYVVQNDVFNELKGLYFVCTLDQLEGSTPGDFTAADARVTNWCNLCLPHGYDLSIAINVTGNANAGGAPAYMVGNSTYGPVSTTSGGTGSFGGVYLNAGAIKLTRVQNANVAARLAVILAHHAALIASKGVTFYAVWVTYSECSFDTSQQSAGWDATTFCNGMMLPGGTMNQLRSALPTPKLMVSPTFLVSPDGLQYDSMWATWQAGLKNYYVSNGNYDSTNETGGATHRAYPGDTQFRGVTTGGVVYPSCQNLVGVGDAFCHQSEDSLCKRIATAAVPPAQIGDGTLPIVSPHWTQQGISEGWFANNGFEGQLCNNFQQSANWGPAPNYSTCDWDTPGTKVGNGGICGYLHKHWPGGPPNPIKPPSWP